MIARHYIIHARQGEEKSVKAGLVELVELARSTPGCRGIDLLHDLDNGCRFFFLETWESVEAHKSAVNPDASALLARLIPLFDGRPEAAYCGKVSTA
ncbi:putative quinol monooxygenase [Sphingobium amiense]|uniref:putative quinol monooxygenase n=1 Tax=Sphingobium amiense TaxID=135719 RepID=UPI000834E521|nr:antibiotic biosynthesis monooxygenase [Sphingobium amiense]